MTCDPIFAHSHFIKYIEHTLQWLYLTMPVAAWVLCLCFCVSFSVSVRVSVGAFFNYIKEFASVWQCLSLPESLCVYLSVCVNWLYIKRICKFTKQTNNWIRYVLKLVQNFPVFYSDSITRSLIKKKKESFVPVLEHRWISYYIVL